MASPLRRPSAAPSLDVALARVRLLSRRVPIIRLLVALVATVLVVQTLTAADRAATEARSEWAADQAVWVARRSIEPGAVIVVDDVELRHAPAALRPEDAMATDPTGGRARVALAKGEVLRIADLGPQGAGPIAALVREGQQAVTIRVSADIYAAGDVVGIVALLDGRVLVEDGVVVATPSGSVAIAVAKEAVPRIVGELSRGGVEVTLVGG